mgnify:FL=1
MHPVVRAFIEEQWKLRLGPRLGSGGFAEVWQAETPEGVPCALKISLSPLDEHDTAIMRELENLRLVCAIGGHPHVVSLMDFALVQGYLVSRWELAPDGTLADRLRQCQQAGRRGIPLNELIRYMADAAEGIDFLNRERGILHRDIKPTNLLLFHGRVKVGDLGLAKLAGATMVSHSRVGTLGYLPPEAYEEERLHPTVDLYSLAATYVELRTGRKPFGENPVETVRRQLTGRPEVDQLSPREREHVLKALAPNPEDRPQEGARKWVGELRAALSGDIKEAAGKGSGARPEPPVPPPEAPFSPPLQAEERPRSAPPPPVFTTAEGERGWGTESSSPSRSTAIISCWQCGQKVTVLRDYIGRKVQCPHCGALMEVPASAFGLPPEAYATFHMDYNVVAPFPSRKSPGVAALLNLLFWGAGYVYSGRAWGWFLLAPFLILSVFTIGIFALVMLILGIPTNWALAWHAYQLVLEDRRWGKPRERRINFKSPSTAAILNFMFWGLGYIYTGRQWAWLLFVPYVIAASIVSLVAFIVPPVVIFYYLVDVPISLALAWHAYSIVNEDIERRMNYARIVAKPI